MRGDMRESMREIWKERLDFQNLLSCSPSVGMREASACRNPPDRLCPKDQG